MGTVFREQNFIKASNCFLKLLILIEGVKINLRMITNKYSDDSAKHFDGLKVFTETTRQRGRYSASVKNGRQSQ